MKIKLLQMANDDTYNEVTLEKNKLFLDHLQGFVKELGLGKPSSAYEVAGKKYDKNTYYTLFYEDPKKNFETKKQSISRFKDGHLVRYHAPHLELLIIFLERKIKIIFHCDGQTRKKVVTALRVFVKGI
jgi:hypothetical protein